MVGLVSRIRAYFASQIEEIAQDRVLRIYGAILACSHLLTLAWWIHVDAEEVLSAGREHICWPLLQGCQDFPYPAHEVTQVIFTFYGVVAAATTLLFALRREVVRVAYGSLMLLTVAKLALMALDFRTRLNQHYMIFFATVPFLFLPGKKVAIRLIIPLFYFWAGILKLNREWLSGSAIYAQLWLLNDRTLPFACAYVVLLELVGIWGLWARNKWIFWGTLVQLALFHLVSYAAVGFFYPLLMGSLLMIFPLCRVADGERTAFPRGPHSRPALAWVGVFSILQLLPYCFPGDTAITGEGRLFALHMFDAKVECESRGVIHRENVPDESVDLNMVLPPRIHCDPIVYVSRGRALCRRLEHTPGFVDIDVKLTSKRTTDARAVPVMDVAGFCKRKPRYSLFWPNDWIQR